MPLWVWIASGVIWAILVAATAGYSKIPEWVAVGASILLTLVYISNPVVSLFNHHFDMSCLSLWFFGVSIFALTEFKIRNLENVTSSGGWSKPMTVLLGALLLFSQYVYPHLKASWGGGTPVSVTVYFTKDSLLNPSKAVQAQLVDESDEGFYIVGLKESKAIFIPRNAVAMVYFSDKPSESPLLQGNKTLALEAQMGFPRMYLRWLIG